LQGFGEWGVRAPSLFSSFYYFIWYDIVFVMRADETNCWPLVLRKAAYTICHHPLSIAKAAMCTLRVMGNRKGLQGSAKKYRRSHARQDNLPHLPTVILIIAHTFMTGLSGQCK